MVRHQDTKWPHQVKYSWIEKVRCSPCPDSRQGAAGLYADPRRPTGTQGPSVSESHPRTPMWRDRQGLGTVCRQLEYGLKRLWLALFPCGFDHCCFAEQLLTAKVYSGPIGNGPWEASRSIWNGLKLYRVPPKKGEARTREPEFNALAVSPCVIPEWGVRKVSDNTRALAKEMTLLEWIYKVIY